VNSTPQDGEQYDESFDEERRTTVGVGPHPGPWPDGDQYDRRLLADGDRRNVVDRYRYWTREAIVADLDTRRHGFHVAVENWQHDFNIGSVVRTANAFLAAGVHIVGRRRWNRRGAMVTDRYQHVLHHPEVDDLAGYAAERGLPMIGIDNLPGSVPLEKTELPERCVLSSARRARGSPRPPGSRRRWSARSRSSAPPGRSTRARPRRSPCTAGSAATRWARSAEPPRPTFGPHSALIRPSFGAIER
jgi:hypothetical protein